MKSQLPYELDGTGGGYGRYPGISTADLAQKFEILSADENMRSIRAVLRITREQIEARGFMGSYRWVVVFAVVLAALAGSLYFVLPESFRKTDLTVTIAATVLAVVYGFGVWKTSDDTKRSVAQEKEIRRLAIETLTFIAEKDTFKPKKLDATETRTLQDLLKRSGEPNEPLQRLLVV